MQPLFTCSISWMRSSHRLWSTLVDCGGGSVQYLVDIARSTARYQSTWQISTARCFCQNSRYSDSKDSPLDRAWTRHLSRNQSQYRKSEEGWFCTSGQSSSTTSSWQHDFVICTGKVGSKEYMVNILAAMNSA